MSRRATPRGGALGEQPCAGAVRAIARGRSAGGARGVVRAARAAGARGNGCVLVPRPSVLAAPAQRRRPRLAGEVLGHHQPHARPPAARGVPARALGVLRPEHAGAARRRSWLQPSGAARAAGGPPPRDVRRRRAADGALEALRDTRVVFLGDSLMQNVFEALTTALHREGHAFRARRWNPSASSAASTTTSPAACARCATRAARRWAARSSTSNSRGRRAARRAAGCSASTRRRARSATRTRATTRRRARSTCR